MFKAISFETVTPTGPVRGQIQCLYIHRSVGGCGAGLLARDGVEIGDQIRQQFL